MKQSLGLPIACLRAVLTTSLLLSAFVCPPGTLAQGVQGQDDVYDPNGNQKGSYAFIDASTFAIGGLDFCGVLHTVLATVDRPSTYPYGAVIDARGLPTSNPPTSMICSASPWGTGSNYVNVPSTILLPAGIIYIPSEWILPDGTKIIGEGAGGFEGTNSSLVSSTILRACNNNQGCPNFHCLGNGPLAGVILDANGNLYGTTVEGGNTGCGGLGCGVVFEITSVTAESYFSDGTVPTN